MNIYVSGRMSFRVCCARVGHFLTHSMIEPLLGCKEAAYCLGKQSGRGVKFTYLVRYLTCPFSAIKSITVTSITLLPYPTHFSQSNRHFQPICELLI
jgi:hypothetical protein